LIPEKIPPEFRKQLVQLSKEFDTILSNLVKATSESIFQLQLSRWQEYHFPSLHNPADHPNRFNLLDIAYYLNQPPDDSRPNPESNCAAHHDPGLFSLSIFQSAPGELFIFFASDAQRTLISILVQDYNYSIRIQAHGTMDHRTRIWV
jgi:hypothetical protein